MVSGACRVCTFSGRAGFLLGIETDYIGNVAEKSIIKQGKVDPRDELERELEQIKMGR